MEYIIETILPRYGVHLIGGGSGAGKTTLLLQMIDAINNGREFLGHSTHPTQYLYIVADRDLGSVQATLDRVRVQLPKERVVSALNKEVLSYDRLVDLLYRIRGTQKLHVTIYIEGIVRMLSGNMNDYGAIANWLASLTEFTIKNNCTIIGTVHSSKGRERDLIYNPRERILGSVAFAAYTKTIIFIEPTDPKDPTNPTRRVWVMPRDHQNEEHDFSFTDEGRLMLTANAETSFLFEANLTVLPMDAEITTQMVMEWAEVRNVSERSATRWLRGMVDSGAFERIGRGRYRRVQR